MAVAWTDLFGSDPSALGADSAVVEGTIASSPDRLDEGVMVTIDAFDTHQKFGPCPWVPIIGYDPYPTEATILPARGDRCLVAFAQTSDTGEPEAWVLQWWPYGAI